MPNSHGDIRDTAGKRHTEGGPGGASRPLRKSRGKAPVPGGQQPGPNAPAPAGAGLGQPPQSGSLVQVVVKGRMLCHRCHGTIRSRVPCMRGTGDPGMPTRYYHVGCAATA